MNNDRFKFRCWVEKNMVNYSFKCYITPYAIKDEWAAIFHVQTVARNIIDIIGKKNTRKYCEFLLNLDGCSKGLVSLPCVVEQCTGAKDKNGKLIYEGDILQIGEILPELYIIKHEPMLAAGLIGVCSTHGQDIKYLSENGIIVGNIHENKELLNG